MGERRVSIKDVSALAGVSTATVSNVFSGRKPVNEELRERVRQAAQSLGYEADRAASQLRSGRTRVIAVLVPDLTDTFFATIVSQIEIMAHAKGYDVIVASSRDDPAVEASRLSALLAWKPAGIIAVPCTDRVPDAIAASVGSLPVVLVDRVVTAGAVADTVTIDNRDAGAVAARHLVERGHRDVVLAASSMSIAPIRERVDAAAELVARETGYTPTILELGSSPERGAATFGHWLERHAVPDAIIAVTNVTTLSVLTALARFRLTIPDQTSVLAFDDYAWMSARNTGLTAIRQPVEDIAGAAWDRLVFRLEGNADAPLLSTVLSARLVVRASVKQLEPAKTRSKRDRRPPGIADEAVGGPGRDDRKVMN